MNENVMIDLLLTMAFSLFGMLLIFGLGFVFPTIDPYVVIRWIILVCAAVFVYALLRYMGTWFSKTKKGGKK